MIRQFRTTAPAKLNLFLELPARRDDGFHEIDTVIVAIDLCDHLSMSVRNDGQNCIETRWSDEYLASTDPSLPTGPPLPAPQDNLVTAALDRFCSALAPGIGFDVDMEKNIPAGAGMGGASSDAAAALRIAEIATRPTTTIPNAQRHQIVREIAASIGSDVPFFLGGPPDPASSEASSITAARCTGRGEVITPIAGPESVSFVVAHPGVSLSTARVYQASELSSTPVSGDEFCRAFERDSQTHELTFVDQMLNRLTGPARRLCPEIDDLIRLFREAGLPHVQLTGSGSACFGVVENAADAAQIAADLRDRAASGTLVTHARSQNVPGEVVIC